MQTPVPPLPEVYFLPSWQDPIGLEWPISVHDVLTAIYKLRGTVPPTLDDERTLLVFAGSANLRVTDLDVESSVVFPQRVYVHRDWLREQWEKFRAWAVAVGIIDPNQTNPQYAEAQHEIADYRLPPPPKVVKVEAKEAVPEKVSEIDLGGPYETPEFPEPDGAGADAPEAEVPESNETPGNRKQRRAKERAQTASV